MPLNIVPVPTRKPKQPKAAQKPKPVCPPKSR